MLRPGVLKVGDTVQSFVIIAPLGEGGMGEVYVARDKRLNRQVALKIVRADEERRDGLSTSGRRSGGAARLVREAQAAAGLEHPNVVTIYEVGEALIDGEKAPFVAMELVRGKSLRVLRDDPDFPVVERLRCLTDVARALAVAHKSGLVHRDVKPENVMLREDGVVKVLDFGLAKRATRGKVTSSSSTEAQVLPSLTTKGVTIGTPHYMAPEQMRNEPLDGRTDQFAWGVMAYELLSGTLPWGLDLDAIELVSKVLTVQPPSLSEVCPEVPASVAAAVARAMSKSPGDRFESTDDLVAALDGKDAAGPRRVVDPLAVTLQDAALPPRPSPAIPPSAKSAPSVRSPPPQAPGRARRWLVAGIGAALLASVSAAVVALRRDKGSTRSPSRSTSAAASAPRECDASRACVEAHGGEAWVCRKTDHRCAKVASEDCEALVSSQALRAADPLWVGTLYPRSGAAGELYGRPYERAADLARRELEQVLSGLTQRGDTRPLGLVACDDKEAPRALAHMVNDVQTPAVVGFASGEVLRSQAASLLVPHGVLSLATLTTDPLVTRVPTPEGSPRLVWRLVSSDGFHAEAVAAAMEARLEALARRTSGLTLKDDLRVAFLRPGAERFGGASKTLLERLRFNGKGAIENGPSYTELVVAAQGASPTTLEALRRFAPHIVIYTGGAGVARAALSALEGLKTMFVVAGAIDPELLAAPVGRSLARRLFGFLPATQLTNAQFTAQYNATFPQTPVTREASPSESYDAVYMVAYAAMAAGDRADDGRELARRFPLLLGPGAPITVGSGDIFDAYRAMRAGQVIDLVGATGTLDFDRESGEVLHDLVVTCVTTAHGTDVMRVAESGATFRARTRRVDGALSCP